MDYVWVGIGGLIGANARFVLGRLAVERLGGAFPYGTLFVNLTGSLAIGLLATLLAVRVVDPAWRLLVITGFLGGYTTFSAYSFEMVALLEDGRWGRAAIYALGSNLLGFVACASGMVLARLLAR